MSTKPDLKTAMTDLLAQVKIELPIYDQDTFVCGPESNCIGCPKKLMELVESEVSYWDHNISSGNYPNFEEIRRFGKLCNNVKRGLARNGIV